MSEKLPPQLAETLANLELFPDRQDRIHYLISIADRFRGVPPEVAEPPYPADRLVPDCESEAYLWALPQEDGTLRFHFAVENPQGISAKAMAVILEDALSGRPLDEVAAVPGDLPHRIFGRELSMGKSMGLMGMLAMVKASARRAAEAG